MQGCRKVGGGLLKSAGNVLRRSKSLHLDGWSTKAVSYLAASKKTIYRVLGRWIEDLPVR